MNLMSHMIIDVVSGYIFPSSRLTDLVQSQKYGEGKTCSRYDMHVKVDKLSQWKKKEARGLQSNNLI